MKLPEIIGVAGTNGAGKDTLAVVRHQVEGADSVSLSDILRAELDKRGLEHDRQNLGAVGDELRRTRGPGVLPDMAIEQYRQTHSHQGLSITSVRTVAEAEEIKAQGGAIVWIDADPQIRYERIISRNAGRPTDQKTFEEFRAEEEAEMHPSKEREQDKTVMNMAGVRDIADIFIVNEFSSQAAYEEYLKTEFELS